MRRIFEWVGGFALIAFSFYFTDRVSLLVANKSELMQEIKSVSATYETPPVDAVINIDENSITPGLFGKKVNSEESYLCMHDFGTFNENYLKFDYIKPNTSLEDNKDKFITGGNPNNRQISFIIKDNDEIAKFFDESKIQYDVILTNQKETSEYAEIINGANDKSEFNLLNSKIENNKKICVKDTSNMELCKKNSYFLINPKLELSNTNLIDIKNNIAPGSVILISSGVKIENVKLMLNEIGYKDLKIVHISKLIDEKES